MNIVHELIQQVEQYEDELIALRRQFHQYPEIGWLEFYTTGTILQYLKKYDIPFFYGKDVVNAKYLLGREEEKIPNACERACELGIEEELLQNMEGITGAVAVIKGKKKGKVIVLRFDIDGLCQVETTALDHEPQKEGFASKNVGCMHACGHDGHIAMGLILARILYENREKWNGEIRIIFQPAEEEVRGAKSFAKGCMINGVDYFLSGHLGLDNKSKELVLGTYGFLATTKMDVRFIGESAHAGASPECGKNALLCACHAVMSLQTLCQDSRGVSRINVGVIQAGTARNVIAKEATIQMEIRGETGKIERDLYEKVIHCIKGCCMIYGCEYEIEIKGQAPDATSDQEFVNKAKQALCKANLWSEEVNKQCTKSPIETLYETKTFKASEDVTYFMTEVQKQKGQALYLGIGANTKAPHHSASFDFDEFSLCLGVKTYLAIVTELFYEETTTIC